MTPNMANDSDNHIGPLKFVVYVILSTQRAIIGSLSIVELKGNVTHEVVAILQKGNL